MTHPISVPIKLLSPRATLPSYQSALAAGMDLHACLPEGESITIRPGQIAMVPLGFAIALPPGYEAQVRPRSGLATKHGLSIPNSPGTVDADYRGEMRVAVINHGSDPYTIHHAARIAQMVVAPVSRAALSIVAELDETPRGAGGFGSTGH